MEMCLLDADAEQAFTRIIQTKATLHFQKERDYIPEKYEGEYLTSKKKGILCQKDCLKNTGYIFTHFENNSSHFI